MYSVFTFTFKAADGWGHNLANPPPPTAGHRRRGSLMIQPQAQRRSSRLSLMLFRANKANQPSAVDGGHFWNEMGSLIRPLVSPEPPPLSAACLSLQPSTPRIRAPAHPRSHVIEQVPAQVPVQVSVTSICDNIRYMCPRTPLWPTLHRLAFCALAQRLLLLLLLPLLLASSLPNCLFSSFTPFDKKSLPLFPC